MLRGAAVLGAAGLAFPGRSLAAAAIQPRIAIIGGGIAGLSAALTLRDAGYLSTIYEAMPSRTGGRMLSDRSVPSAPACGSCHPVSANVPVTWAEGQVTDVFGELVDSGHATMQSLCERYGLPLVDLLAAEPPGSTDTYFFKNAYYPYAHAQADFKQVFHALKKDLKAAGYPSSFDSNTAAGRALDSMSISQWIDSRVPGGHSSAMGRLLDAAYAIEYGADCTEQSALNLVYLLGYAPQGKWSVYGESDERYRISGGVDLLTRAITNDLVSRDVTVKLDTPLESVVKRPVGNYQLTFENARPVVADYVILALPFSAFSNFSYDKAGFDALKLRAIDELGAGKNGKVQLQFNTRVWNGVGPWGRSNGNLYSDVGGLQAGWESTRGMAGTAGILLKFTGGSAATAMNLRHAYGNSSSPAVQADARVFLGELERLFPGISAQWNGRCAGAMPHRNPFFKSSYAFYKVGQYQAFAGYEKARQGNVLFAGEHTSQDYQGYMEGGASEGIRAAEEVLADLSVVLPK